jgi:hypothetical protein
MLLDVTRQSQPKCTGSTQEIPRQQKQRIWQDKEINKWTHRIPK